MKINRSVQQIPAFKPMQAVVRDALDEADQETRELLLKTAVLREFNGALLSRLASPRIEATQEMAADLAQEVALHMPVSQSKGGAYNYDEITREALLAEAIAQNREETLISASQAVAGYYHDQARLVVDPVERQKYEDQALFYELQADPGQGFGRWETAWAALPKNQAEFERKASLIQVAEQLWPDLADVPGAQVTVLIKKGWLAYNLDDWQRAVDTFWQVLGGRRPSEVTTRLYLGTSRTGELMDGRKDRLNEAEANVGLGYANFQLGALGQAARHFEKAGWLAGRSRKIVDETPGLTRTRALIGLGETCLSMGAMEGALVRCLLLPEAERRKTLREYEAAEEAQPLEDVALGRLLREASMFFNEALAILPDSEQGKSHRLRVEARQARVLLEQGSWTEAEAAFKKIHEKEQARGGSGADIQELRTFRENPRLANRLAWINLYLGDCRLLSAWLTAGASEPVAAGDRVNTAAENEARSYYHLAWGRWKEINDRKGIALVLRREGDLEAMHPADSERRSRALSRYQPSLELYEQIGNTGEIALAQERIELLLERVRQVAGDSSAEEEVAKFEAIQKSFVEEAAQTGDGSDMLTAFRHEVGVILTGRRRFFRYRFARKFDRWLRRTYRLTAGFIGLMTGGLFSWLILGNIPWISRTSQQVTGLAWALPALIVAVFVFLAIGLADNAVRIRRFVVGLIPRRFFWLSQEQIAVDEIGLHVYDDADQHKLVLLWPEIREVRSQYWSPTWNRGGPGGGEAIVYDVKEQSIRFDTALRGYNRLMTYIKRYLAESNGERWREPKLVTVHGRFLPIGLGLLMMGLMLACPLTLVFAFIRPLTRFGPAAFAIVTTFMAIMVLLMILLKVNEWLYIHPQFRTHLLRRLSGSGNEPPAAPKSRMMLEK